MYAIIEDGQHQLKVEEGQQLDIDYRGLSAGDEVKFERVLAVRGDEGLKIGRPMVESAFVTATVVSPVVQGPKVVIQKFRRRKNYRRRTGHRQMFTRVVIEKIVVG